MPDRGATICGDDVHYPFVLHTFYGSRTREENLGPDALRWVMTPEERALMMRWVADDPNGQPPHVDVYRQRVAAFRAMQGGNANAPLPPSPSKKAVAAAAGAAAAGAAAVASQAKPNAPPQSRDANAVSAPAFTQANKITAPSPSAKAKTAAVPSPPSAQGKAAVAVSPRNASARRAV